MDPDTNMVYIVNGYVLYAGVTDKVSMMVYDATKKTFASVPTAFIDSNLDGYSAVWSTLRKSMLVYGGWHNGPGGFGSFTVSDFYEYKPATNKWSNITTTGAGPGNISYHCMTPAYAGSKMVVFGGQDQNRKDIGAIHVLDLTTMIWTAGIAAVSVRSGPACAVAGDSFLAWGAEAKSDLAKRQLALLQVEHELNMEKLRVAEELKMRQMEEEEELSGRIAVAATGPLTAIFEPQWAVVDEKTLYIQGGQPNTQPTVAFSLDLTKTFTDMNPPWKPLSTGPTVTGQCMVVSSDKSKLLMIDTLDPAVLTYTIATNKWQNTTALTNLKWIYDAHAVMDPDTNTVYMVNGYAFYNSSARVAMLVYDATRRISSSVPTTFIPEDLTGYSAVWSTLRKSMLIYGGSYNTSDFVSTFYEYVPGTKKWSNVTTTGTSPGKLSGHCMVSAYSGTKMVVFGGVTPDDEPVLGTFYFLDLVTMVWTNGTSSATVRYDMACAVAGDSFLAWGGCDENGCTFNATTTTTSTIPLIYNMRTNQWVHQFDPTPYQAPSTTQGPSPTNTQSPDTTTASSSDGSNAKSIGGAVGAIAGLGVIGAFYFFRHKKSRQQARKDRVPADMKDLGGSRFSDESVGRLSRAYMPPSPISASCGIDSPPTSELSSPRSNFTDTDKIYTKGIGRSPHSPTSTDHPGARGGVILNQGRRSPEKFYALLASRPKSIGAPHGLLHETLEPSASITSKRESASKFASSAPSSKTSKTVETASDLARRQLALLQVERELNLEKLRVAEEMRRIY
ncbi:Leucine-zipper-like transcriptional regulator 1 [Gryganskiella cystojenkinii]|nr:Leucine-zipper-like transcriptional regulator 1 [Gryganskiella cystojenkinii]